MGLIDSAIDAMRFKDVVFYKENSDLEDQYNALVRLDQEYPNNDDILSELFFVKKGLVGENEIEYQLKKANLGMYVLRDLKIAYEDLTAQIDYFIITPVYNYYVECKNLAGNITVNENGDFIRDYTINGHRIRKGMYSPLRQVEAQREVMRKIIKRDTSAIKQFLAGSHFDYYNRVLVVAANQETILKTSKAPKDIKSKILRADALVRKLEYDYNHRDKNEWVDSKNEMEKRAQRFINRSVVKPINYYEYYKEKFHLTTVSQPIISKKTTPSKDCSIPNTNPNFCPECGSPTTIRTATNGPLKGQTFSVCSQYPKCKYMKKFDDLRELLSALRKQRSTEMNLPAYYVFTNEELEKLLEIRPKTLEELKSANILAAVRINTHGDAIIAEINRQN